MSDIRKHLDELRSDEEFMNEFNALAAQYELARQVIEARIALGITQKQLADRIGTSQANISKLEHAELNPSLDMAQRVAKGLGKRLSVSLS